MLRQHVRRRLDVNGASFQYYNLEALTDLGNDRIQNLPASIKILLGNQLRHCDGIVVNEQYVKNLINWTES